MEITIRHLSGSKAGQEQAFPPGRITIGRDSSNHVAFDPHQDSIVSGQHAELSPRDDGWLLRDLQSRNGTFINEERVSERVLRPGEVIQLGKNGPRLQIQYELPAGAAAPIPISNAPVEGRTVMMMMNEGAPAPAGAGAASAAVPGFTPQAHTSAPPAKKKGGLLRALLVVVLVFGFLIVAGVVAFVFLSSGSESVETGDAQTATATAAEPTAAASGAGMSMAEVAKDEPGTMSEAASGTGMAATTGTVDGEAMAAASPPAATATQPTASDTPRTVSDLEQQLARSQELIDGLQKQLQEKNDTLAKTIKEKDAAIQRAIRERNAAIQRARQAEARAQQPQSSLELSPFFLKRPRPVQVAGMIPPGVLMNLAMQADDGPASSGPLSRNKYLKKRIGYVYEDPEIPLPEMPSDMPEAIGALVIQALGTTGRYIPADTGGDASISVVVTNYKSDVRTRVNTEAVTSAVGAISGIFGGPSVDSPVDTRSVSMNADMTARVKLIDPDSVELLETFAEAKSSGRKTSADIAGLGINEIANTETALGDVTRKVAADAVEKLLVELENVPWKGWITDNDPEKKTLTIDCGTRCQIEAGDVFGIYNYDERVGTARVRRVTPDSAEALIADGETEVIGMSVRYDGRTGDSPLTRKSQQERSLRTRNATQAYAGPGTTFGDVKKLNAGAELRLVFVVGSWAKVSDGSASFWIPLASAQITG